MVCTLEASDLTFSYRELTLFKAADFSFSEGKVTRVAGANGAGKSTLLQIIAGLQTPQRGTIELCGHSGADSHHDELIYLGAEGNGHYRNLTARANLQLWQDLDEIKQDVEQVLAYWGLKHRLLQTGMPVRQFSTGLKRRLALARVHNSQRKIILLDEPSHGLDAQGILLLKEMLTNLKKQRRIVIVVSHDAALCDVFDTTIELTRCWSH